jgi:SAM-dependent methyltransferase
MRHQIIDNRIENDSLFNFAQFDIPEWRDRLETQIMPMVHDHIRLDRLEGKRVVDLACGYGFWGKQLLDYKPLMIYIDGRQEHLDTLKQEQPDALTYCMNLEEIDLEFHADIVLCMGIIYHIADPRRLFDQIARTTGVVFVDTTVCDNDKEVIYHLSENNQAQGFSVTGNACRPSPRWVENNLRDAGFTHVFDISDARGNVPASPGMSGLMYDWKYERTCGWRRNEQTLRKMYMATKKWPHELLK